LPFIAFEVDRVVSPTSATDLATAEGRSTALGTYAFGRGDTPAALRASFEVDRYHVVIAALCALAGRGDVRRKTAAEVITKI
jgi:pyruvate dehydrogenase E1 component